MENVVSSARKRSNHDKFAILIGLFVLALVISFMAGRYFIRLPDLLKIIANRLFGYIGRLIGRPLGIPRTWPEAAEIVAINIRLPRIAASALIGAALSTAGVSYQGIFRNPMVSPDILGASTGAGFGAALGIFLGFGYTGIILLAFSFGLGAVFLTYTISRASRLDGTLSMVLAGIMVSSLLQASTSFIKLVADTDNQLPAITYWLMGSLNSMKGTDMLFVAVITAIGILPLVLLRWRINLLTLSEDEARSLGVDTVRLRLIVIICATLITAASVSVSGMIGWVGLVIPHFCRLIFGYDYRRLIPAAVLLGSTFLIVVDDLARNITTGEIPLGILTSFVGAPVFVWLILRKEASA